MSSTASPRRVLVRKSASSTHQLDEPQPGPSASPIRGSGSIDISKPRTGKRSRASVSKAEVTKGSDEDEVAGGSGISEKRKTRSSTRKVAFEQADMEPDTVSQRGQSTGGETDEERGADKKKKSAEDGGSSDGKPPQRDYSISDEESDEDDFTPPNEEDFSNPKIFVQYRSFELSASDVSLEERTFSRGDYVFVRPGGIIGKPVRSKSKGKTKRDKSKLRGSQPGASKGHDHDASGPDHVGVVSRRETENDADPNGVEDVNGDGAEVWIAKVLRIRADGSQNVWLNISWLYASKEQLRFEGCTNIPEVIARNEVFPCNSHEDLINAQTVDGRAIVCPFDDTLPLSEQHIGRLDYWYRSEFVLDGRTAKGKRKRPHIRPVDEAGNSACTVCDEGYMPLNTASASTSQQIFCPSLTCGTWTHVACLEPMKLLTSETLAQLEITGLDEEGKPTLDAWTDDVEEIQRWQDLLDQQLVHAPLQDVVDYARSSIVRGGRHNIEGNGLDVLAARAELWKRRNKGEDKGIPPVEPGNLASYFCPACSGPL